MNRIRFYENVIKSINGEVDVRHVEAILNQKRLKLTSMPYSDIKRTVIEAIHDVEVIGPEIMESRAKAMGL